MDQNDNNKNRSQRFGAVILSAGYSSRMKAFKPLLPLEGVPVIQRMIEMLRRAGLERITAVTGYQRELLQPLLRDLQVMESYNPRFDEGMFTSIQQGLSDAKAALPQAEGYFLMPVDCPLIDETVLQQLMLEWEPGNFHVPIYEGKKGHPLLVPAELVDEICSYDGPGGLKAITDRYWDRMRRIPVPAEGCLLDMDTPEGYEEIKNFLGVGCRRRPLQELAKGRKILLVRHGQTRQHAEKMFIGQYDVPLDDLKQSEIIALAENLKAELAAGDENFFGSDSFDCPVSCDSGNSGNKIRRIYSSDLERAAETAVIINEACGWNAEILQEPAFREIALGAWDGKPIRVVREEYPQEYQRRGEDLFAFKIGNKSENFYDLQYRAVKRLREILEQDPSEIIVLVTHSGVIRALENNLKGLRVDDPWDSIPKCSCRILEI